MSSLDPYEWPRAPREQVELPWKPGLYALFLRPGARLSGVTPLSDGLIYIGMSNASGGLASRCHFQDATRSHSPRRSLAALLFNELKLTPIPGGKRSFGLDHQSEAKLTKWMHKNLLVSFTQLSNPQPLEKCLIRKYAPPLNLTQCGQSVDRTRIRRLRAQMRALANDATRAAKAVSIPTPDAHVKRTLRLNIRTDFQYISKNVPDLRSPNEPNTFMVTDLARELGVDCKTARDRLRHHFGKLEQHEAVRWCFPVSLRNEIARIIR